MLPFICHIYVCPVANPHLTVVGNALCLWVISSYIQHLENNHDWHFLFLELVRYNAHKYSGVGLEVPCTSPSHYSQHPRMAWHGEMPADNSPPLVVSLPLWQGQSLS